MPLTSSQNVAIAKLDADSAVDGGKTAQQPSIATNCVICLEVVDESAIALPCKHNHFHLSCLGTWLFVKRTCPLCKTEVEAIRYTEVSSGRHDSKVFSLSAEIRQAQSPQHQVSRSQFVEDRRRRYSQHHRRRRRTSSEAENAATAILRFRKSIYQHGLYSKHVGTNRYSAYRVTTPAMIRSSDLLLRKARAFIRRELQVFDFLESNSADRRTTNVEFLLDYIIEVIKVVEIKGSAGQAEELISEFLGRANARLFLHELESWLRSPFERLREWDEVVQYPEV